MTQVSTAERELVCETAVPIQRARVVGVAVHVRSALLDADVLSHVHRVLQWNSDSPAAVTATIRGGAITLHGVVDWSYQRLAAERVVRTVIGVRSVTNQIASRHAGS